MLVGGAKAEEHAEGSVEDDPDRQLVMRRRTSTPLGASEASCSVVALRSPLQFDDRKVPSPFDELDDQPDASCASGLVAFNRQP